MSAAAERPDLRGRVAVVTGAGRGIGHDVAIELAARGARVVLAGRTVSALDSTVAEIRDGGGEALVVPTDVSAPDQVAALRASAEREFGTVSVVVNAAGVFGPVAPIVESDPGEWIQTQQINLIGPYLVCREFVPEAIAMGWGRIVNVSSSAGLGEPESCVSAYAISKTALNRFTRQLAVELEGTGVSANAIHPGSLKTDMWDDIRRKADALGDRAQAVRDWAEEVGRTGGDSPAAAVAVVLRAIEAPVSVNGQFLWPEGGREKPIPSW